MLSPGPNIGRSDKHIGLQLENQYSYRCGKDVIVFNSWNPTTQFNLLFHGKHSLLLVYDLGTLVSG